MTGIPVLNVEADCIARGWENSLIELHARDVISAPSTTRQMTLRAKTAP